MKKHKEEPEQHCTRSRETSSKFPVTIARCLGDAQASNNKEQSTEARGLARTHTAALLLFNPSELW